MFQQLKICVFLVLLVNVFGDDNAKTTTEAYNWRKNSTIRGVRYGEALGGIDDVIETLKAGPNNDIFQLIFMFLPESGKAVEKSLTETSNHAFVAYTNMRYQHCWNVTTEIPPDVYVDAVSCALENIKDGMNAIVKKLKELIKVKDFFKHTIKRYKVCEANRKKFHNVHNTRVKRSLQSIRKSFEDNFSKICKRVSTSKEQIIKFGSLVTKHIGRRVNLVKEHMAATFARMRKQMTQTAKVVFKKVKIVAAKTLKVAKLTTDFITTYYCFVDATLTAQEEAEKIAHSYGLGSVFNSSSAVQINGTTIAEDFLDQFGVLTEMHESVKSCVSRRVDNYAQKLCSNGNVPHFSDIEELESHYVFETVDDQFDAVPIRDEF